MWWIILYQRWSLINVHKLSDSSVESKRNQDVLGVNSMALSLFRVSIIVAKFVCLFGVFRPTREFFSHIEKSPLPAKGCKFWPMLGTYGHWAVRIFSVPHFTVARGIHLWWSSPRTRDTHTYCRAFSSRAVNNPLYDYSIYNRSLSSSGADQETVQREGSGGGGADLEVEVKIQGKIC